MLFRSDHTARTVADSGPSTSPLPRVVDPGADGPDTSYLPAPDEAPGYRTPREEAIAAAAGVGAVTRNPDRAHPEEEVDEVRDGLSAVQEIWPPAAPAAGRPNHDGRTSAPDSASGAPRSQTRLNEKYTFDTFVIGASNRFAHAAAVAVSEAPARAYNPLFVWGDSGLGKTHLLHEIGRAHV